MKLYGSIVDNLENALASAQRLRGHPIYKDTLTYWAAVLQEGRRARYTVLPDRLGQLEKLIIDLENELADRSF
jgi:hypothetical protein